MIPVFFFGDVTTLSFPTTTPVQTVFVVLFLFLTGFELLPDQTPWMFIYVGFQRRTSRGRFSNLDVPFIFVPPVCSEVILADPGDERVWGPCCQGWGSVRFPRRPPYFHTHNTLS